MLLGNDDKGFVTGIGCRTTPFDLAHVCMPSMGLCKPLLSLQVSAVQREFVEKLLTKPVFQRHMTAVREVLNMLRAAQRIRSNGELYDDQAIKARILLAEYGCSLPGSRVI